VLNLDHATGRVVAGPQLTFGLALKFGKAKATGPARTAGLKRKKIMIESPGVAPAMPAPCGRWLIEPI
jgi:hypothetical protein